MNTRRIGLVAGTLAVASLLLGLGPELLLGRWVDAGAEPGILPMFKSVGITVAVYTIVVEILAVLVPVSIGIGLGVWLVRHVGEAGGFRGALRAVAAGSAAGVLLAAAVVLALLREPVGLAGAGIYLLLVLEHLTSTALLVTVGAAAGVTVDRFGRGPDTENRRAAAADDGTTPDADLDDTQQQPSTP